MGALLDFLIKLDLNFLQACNNFWYMHLSEAEDEGNKHFYF
jgi:hypothetical protein